LEYSRCSLYALPVFRIICYVICHEIGNKEAFDDLRIKSGPNSGNADYCTVQNLLFFRLRSKNVKVKIYETIILPVVLYGCEIWPLTLREEHRLKVFENRVVRRIFGP
jgi:hypothetical protein